jgi:peptide/nickel transport system substrate-binding protein
MGPIFHLLLLLALTVPFANLAAAATFRWSSQGDLLSADPHATGEWLTITLNLNVYEGLVTRDKDLAIVPALAQSWTRVNDTTWRFQLRPNVTFHDGTP